MKKIITVITLLVVSATYCSAQKKKASMAGEYKYESECMGVEGDGSQTLKSWGTGNSKNDAVEQAKKNAVHAMIFQGFNGNSGSGCPSQKPLTSNPALEDEKKEFFDAFFADGGKYMKFVSVSGDGQVAAEDRMKVGKEYKVGVVVSVMYDLLRKDLEAAGIIKGLSSGF